MTPQEKAKAEEKAAARAAVVARMQDGTVQLEDADARHMTPGEIVQCVNLGRFADVGPDKRLTRRAG